MKALILSILFVAFLFIAVVAVDMGEYGIGGVFAAVSVALLAAVPTKKDKDTAASHARSER